MKILLTTHQFFPKHGHGTEVLARDTGLEMLKRGHEVHVLTVDPDVQVDSGEVGHEDYEYRGLKVRALELPRTHESIDRIRYEYNNHPVARQVQQYLAEVTPDVAHIFHPARLSASIIDAFKKAGLPVAFTPTDFWAICARSTLQKPSGELSMGPDEISSNCLECQNAQRLLPERDLPGTTDKREFYQKIAKRALAKAEDEHPNMELVRAMLARTEFLRERFNAVDAILAPTKLMQQMLTANGIDPDLITISPYGMDTSGFRDAKRHRPDAGELRVGYIGTIHRQKGLDVLMRAFKMLPRDGVTLRVCGDLKHHPDYAREVYDLAGRDLRINFAGPFPNEQMAAELGKIDVLAVPSTWYENTPLVIYSAFAAGIPVVASNLGGMAEVIRHGENGLLFELRDPEGLARQLKRLISEPGLLVELGENAEGVRTVEDSVEEMLDLYELLREHNSGRAQRAASETPSRHRRGS